MIKAQMDAIVKADVILDYINIVHAILLNFKRFQKLWNDNRV